MFEKFPEVDILVNNMGIFKPMDYFEVNDSTWQRFIDVNFMSGNALAKFYLPKMLKQDFGRIFLSQVKRQLCHLVKCHSTV